VFVGPPGVFVGAAVNVKVGAGTGVSVGTDVAVGIGVFVGTSVGVGEAIASISSIPSDTIGPSAIGGLVRFNDQDKVTILPENAPGIITSAE